MRVKSSTRYSSVDGECEWLTDAFLQIDSSTFQIVNPLSPATGKSTPPTRSTAFPTTSPLFGTLAFVTAPRRKQPQLKSAVRLPVASTILVVTVKRKAASQPSCVKS